MLLEYISTIDWQDTLQTLEIQVELLREEQTRLLAPIINSIEKQIMQNSKERDLNIGYLDVEFYKNVSKSLEKNVFSTCADDLGYAVVIALDKWKTTELKLIQAD